MASRIYRGTSVRIAAAFPEVPSAVTFSVRCPIQGNASAVYTYTLDSEEVAVEGSEYVLTFVVPATALVPRRNSVTVVGVGGCSSLGVPADVTLSDLMSVSRLP